MQTQDANTILNRGIAKLDQNPQDVSTLLEMGTLMLELKRWDTATLQLRHALKAAPTSPSVRAALCDGADLLARSGQTVLARVLYLSLLAQYPGDGAIKDAWGTLADTEDAKAIVERKAAKKADYKVSAIVSTYRSAAFMAECLDNLLEQTMAEAIEIVIVDAASPEDEREIIHRYQARHDNISYLRTRSRIGVYTAWNIAIAHATGDYCISVSTNDQLRRNGCELLASALDTHPDVALFYGDTYLTHHPHESYETNSHFAVYQWPEYIFEKHLEDGCCIGPHPMWRRQVHDRLGYFDECFVADGDQEFWMRIGSRYSIRHINEFTGLQWITDESLSGKGDTPALEVAAIQARYRCQGSPAISAPATEVQTANNNESAVNRESQAHSPRAIMNAIRHLDCAGHNEATAWALDNMIADFPDHSAAHYYRAMLADDRGAGKMAKERINLPSGDAHQHVPEWSGIDDQNAYLPDRPLKIVHLCMHDFGGAGNAAYRLHRGLRSIGMDSTMLVLNKKSRDNSVKVLPVRYSDKIVPCIDAPTFNSPIWNQQVEKWHKLMSSYPNRPDGLEMFTDAGSNVKLDRIKEVVDADIVNLHWVSGAMDFANAVMALKHKTIVWTLHDMNAFSGGCHYAGDCQRYKTVCGTCPQLGSNQQFDLARQVWSRKLSTYQELKIHVVTPSQWLGECARASALFSRFTVNVIPYGFPLDTFRPYSKTQIRKASNLPENAKIILFGADSVANKRKGFVYLLEAFNRIAQKNDDDYLLLTFGTMPEGMKIPSRLQVFNTGSIPDEHQLALVYSAADLFVLPSLEDNLPNTVVEAMACGLPVVGFDIGGVPDMVTHRKTGYLAKPKDIDGLLRGIEWVFASYKDDVNFGQRCRKAAEKYYALDNQANAYKALYRQLMTTEMALPS